MRAWRQAAPQPRPAPRITLPESPVTTLDAYRRAGGCAGLQRALELTPSEIIDVLRRSGLRGRGGAGFPTATKWQGIRDSTAETKFVCCNGAEGEPGTFKDRLIFRTNPYQVVEGMMIAARATGASAAYLCLKSNFYQETPLVNRAINEMGHAFDIDVDLEVVLGPDEYLFGEEKALLEVIEGGLPLPRVFPPYIHGLFAGAYGGPSDVENNPTVVNNVETLAHVPPILLHGADWFRRYGTDETPGTMVFSISGDVRRPVVRELPLGMSLRELIFDVAGGLASGRTVKAVLPGLANEVLPGRYLDVPLGFDSMKNAGSALGSGGFIVYDDTACMVHVAHIMSRFLYVESCNQCPPCKTGSGEITHRLGRLMDATATTTDIEEVGQISTWVTNSQRCYLPTSEQLVVASLLREFREDFQAHLEGRCDLRHDMPLPKFVDYIEGQGFLYDTSYAQKQPDWTYGES